MFDIRRSKRTTNPPYRQINMATEVQTQGARHWNSTGGAHDRLRPVRVQYEASQTGRTLPT